jgi:hypothetical protein
MDVTIFEDRREAAIRALAAEIFTTALINGVSKTPEEALSDATVLICKAVNLPGRLGDGKSLGE